MAKKPQLDSIVGKFISRKFFVFLVCLGLMFFKKTLNSSDFVIICTVYIGSQGAVDIVKALTNKKQTIASLTSSVPKVVKDTVSALNRDTKEQPTSDEAVDPTGPSK